MNFKKVIKVNLTREEKYNIMQLLEEDKDTLIDGICDQVNCDDYINCDTN